MILRAGIFILSLCFSVAVTAQTPVPMGTQAGLTYTEDFSDIVNWTDSFASGIGANRFQAVPVIGSLAIPNALRTTASTGKFQTQSAQGVQKGFFQSIVLYTAGTTDNTSSAAIDFLMDFTGVTADSLIYDWAIVNNGAIPQARSGSLRIYYSTNGTTFTEMPGAAEVLNFINNTPAPNNAGTIRVKLPSAFTGSPTARLRFYYHNGTGGSNGSRPKINIDNLKVTAIGLPCATPTAQPTNLTFSNITSAGTDGSFTAASPAANEYLVVASANSTLSSGPVNGTLYNPGDGLGDGLVISRGSSTTFTTNSLSASTHYYFFIFSVNSYCSPGAPMYLSASPLQNDMTTLQGLPDCVAPADQPTALSLSPVSVNRINGTFTASSGSGYLTVRTNNAALNTLPLNGRTYIAGEIIGNGTVVESSSNAAFAATGLSPNTAYRFYVFSFNAQNCLNGPAYNTASPLVGNASTPPLQPCVTPSAQPTSLSLSSTNTAVFATFINASGADNYLVLQSTNPTLSATPSDNIDYSTGNNIGGGTVVYSGAGGSGFISEGLNPATTYNYFIFSANKNCSGGTKYLRPSPLTGSIPTKNDAVTKAYFGNWHAHSDYSDGNKDNPGYTPGDDYLYALGTQCMDFLGISEHNHYTASGNPGNRVANYHLGTAQANAFTSSHPGFTAMYGMEWGVISNGGHVVIYGDGMDDLFGWETGSGNWGSTNNYDVFVAKSDYTGAAGLFKTITGRSAQNTWATLAHPGSSDFNGIATSSVPYDAVADAAIVGSAVETGPAFSINTTYSEPAPSMALLPYFQTLLAKGYHLGPVMDHDNHYTNFGRTTRTRTAVIASANNKTELTKGMYQMNFYATQDCDLQIDFSVNLKPMGSIFSDRFAPVITAKLSDPTTSLTGAVINLMYGVPGSGILPVKISSSTGAGLSFTDNTLANNATAYYYLDITNAGARAISSPIWYTRVDGIIPVTLTTFTAKAVSDRVQLRWATEQEINSKNFIVQRSANGRDWSAVATVAAKGFSLIRNDYTVYDLQPLSGINYYRLQQNDNDGKITYSDIRSVSFDRPVSISVFPNPANDIISVSYKNNNRPVTIQLIDGTGKVLKSITGSSEINHLSVAGFPRGVYFIKLMDEGRVEVMKVSVI